MPPDDPNPSPKSPKKSLVESPTRPQTPPPDPANFPPSLAGLRVWLCWRWERIKGRWTKPPYSAHTAAKADVTDPGSLSTLAEALAHLGTGRADGVGVALEAAGLLGVDLDNCRDSESGELQPWAAEVIRALDSYAEVSPSGTGVKVLVVAAKPPGRCRAGDVEIYDRSRYFTLTGRTLPGSHAEPQPRQAALDAVYRRWLAPPEPAAPGRATPAGPADDELLQIAFAARNGVALRRLCGGDRTGYASDSEADLSLCSLLAFYFPDPAALDAAFRRSGLYRDKWERADYRARTLGKALGGRTEFYKNPNRPGAAPPPPGEPAGAAGPTPGPRPGPAPVPPCWDAPPLPLPTLPPVPAFPLEVIPAAVADYWQAAAASLHVPVDYVAVPGLALLGAAVGRSRSASVKRNYSKPPLLWCVVIAPPSGGKSPALAMAAAPLWRAEARWREQYAQNIATFERDTERHKLEFDAWPKAGCECEPPAKPVKPTLRQSLLDDATAEAAVRVLRENPRGAVLVKDELVQ